VSLPRPQKRRTFARLCGHRHVIRVEYSGGRSYRSAYVKSFSLSSLSCLEFLIQ
jgi:hypothetical protein